MMESRERKLVRWTSELGIAINILNSVRCEMDSDREREPIIREATNKLVVLRNGLIDEDLNKRV